MPSKLTTATMECMYVHYLVGKKIDHTEQNRCIELSNNSSMPCTYLKSSNRCREVISLKLFEVKTITGITISIEGKCKYSMYVHVHIPMQKMMLLKMLVRTCMCTCMISAHYLRQAKRPTTLMLLLTYTCIYTLHYNRGTTHETTKAQEPMACEYRST